MKPLPQHQDAEILVLENINAGYGSLQVLFNISFRVPRNMFMAVVGRNGAGKTTLLKTIAGFVRPYSGRIIFNGEDITGLPPYKRAKKGLIYIRQDRIIFDNLTVRESLDLVAYSFKKSEDDIQKILEIFPRLKERINSKCRFLSGGERQMLLLAQGILSGAMLLLIDEPTEGLAPSVIRDLYEALQTLKSGKRHTVVLVEQRIDLVKELADIVVVLAEGKIIDIIAKREEISALDLGRYKI